MPQPHVDKSHWFTKGNKLWSCFYTLLVLCPPLPVPPFQALWACVEVVMNVHRSLCWISFSLPCALKPVRTNEEQSSRNKVASHSMQLEKAAENARKQCGRTLKSQPISGNVKMLHHARAEPLTSILRSNSTIQCSSPVGHPWHICERLSAAATP